MKHLIGTLGRVTALAVALTMLTRPAFSQETTNSGSDPAEVKAEAADSAIVQAERTGSWELGAYIGLLNDEPEYNPDNVDDQYRRDALIGARAGYTFPFGLMLGTQGSNSLARTRMPDGNGRLPARNVNVWIVEAVLGYNFFISRRFDAFLSAGPGVVICDPDGMDAESDFALNYGAGGRYFFNKRIGVRGDLRMHQVMNVMDGTRREILVDPVQRDLFALELSIGVSVVLGKNPR